MSLKFLPLPLYIAFCLLSFGILMYFAIIRRKKDRKELLAIYITLSLSIPFMILGRTIPKYYDMTAKIIYIIVLFVIIELTLMAVNDFKKGKLKKRVVFSLCYLWLFIVFILLILLHII